MYSEEENMNVLLTGGTGKVGQLLINDLNNAYNLTAISSSVDLTLPAPQNSYIFKDKEVVIHSARIRRKIRPLDRLETFYPEMDNINMTYNTLMLAKRNKVKLVILFSTVHADEHNVYGWASNAREQLGEVFNSDAMKVCYIRIGNIDKETRLFNAVRDIIKIRT